MLGLLLATALAAPSAFDHAYAKLDAFYEGAVTPQGVDYTVLGSRRTLLEGALSEIAQADTAGFDDAQKLALVVNAYNAYTVQLILDHPGVRSIRDLDGGNPWKKRTFRVAGQDLTLDQMEHEHARKLADGRVHAVINCASRGCPPLPPDPLVPQGLDAQLDAAARRWVGANAYGVVSGTLFLSRIFEWYAPDFVRWRTDDVPGADDRQDAALGFLRAFGLERIPAHQDVAWRAYDWSLNAAPAR
ncbi:MAG: DUF547 domain-containing protein [Alphaproteobacteria bacterium]|nr:DUF547 domain-containing protein [Alphaproteobacteria bacterium]